VARRHAVVGPRRTLLLTDQGSANGPAQPAVARAELAHRDLIELGSGGPRLVSDRRAGSEASAGQLVARWSTARSTTLAAPEQPQHTASSCRCRDRRRGGHGHAGGSDGRLQLGPGASLVGWWWPSRRLHLSGAVSGSTATIRARWALAGCWCKVRRHLVRWSSTRVRRRAQPDRDKGSPSSLRQHSGALVERPPRVWWYIFWSCAASHGA
jgi:hypothetical protein